MILAAGIIASPRAALPQTGSTGSITGLVKDATGAVVPSATVTARNAATKVPYTVASSATGNYAIPDLPVGSYIVTVSLAGFKTWSRSGIVVTSGEAARIDAVMAVGEAADQIVVLPAAPRRCKPSRNGRVGLQ